MIHLKLRQGGERVSHKRVREALRGAALVGEAAPPEADAPGRSAAARALARAERRLVGCDRTAEGRVLQCLAIVDNATTETVALVLAQALGGLLVTHVLAA